MLKKVVVTNYLGESITYKITEGDLLSHKNKIPVTLDYIKSANPNNSTRHWINNTTCKIKKSGQDVTFTIRLDSFGRVKAIDVSGYTNASITFKIATCSFETGSSYKLSGCTGGASSKYYLNIKDVTKAVSSAYKNYNNDTNMTNSSYPVSDSFEFSIIFKSTAQVSTTFYPMVRVSTESSEFEPYDDNERGEVDDRSGLFITSIDGLGPVKATINMADISSTDGRIYNSARQSGRNLVITARFVNAPTIEDARQLAYKYFPIKKRVNVKIYSDNRVCAVDGYVESNEPNIFSDSSDIQISILCESPYFMGNEIDELIPSQSISGIEYGGDYENGITIIEDVNYPDNIIDDFSVTDPIIMKNGVDKFGIDTSKMVTLVPNTSPNNTSIQECVFASDGQRAGYIGMKPFFNRVSAGDAYKAINVPIFYKGELHVFAPYANGNDTRIFHYKINSNTGEVIDLPDIITSRDYTGLGETVFIVCKNDVVHFFHLEQVTESMITHSICIMSTFDDVSNVLVDIANWSDSYKPVYMQAFVYNNEIHILSSDSIGSGYRNYHRKFTGSGFTSVETLDNDIFPSTGSTSGKVYTFQSTAIAVLNGAVHVLGGVNYGSGGLSIFYKNHYIWNGTSWTVNEREFPVYSNLITGVAAYKGSIYVWVSGSSSGDVYKYTPSEQTKWPIAFSIGEFGHLGSVDIPLGLGADSKYLYFVSVTSPSDITKPANNDHLIKGDRVVINTNKGKKSVHLIRGNSEYNILNTMTGESSWLEMNLGLNRFSYIAGGNENELSVKIETHELYQGV